MFGRRLAFALACCAGCSAQSPGPTPAAPPTELKDPGRVERPRLVVSVVLDQVGTWVLERNLPHLPKDGALRSAIERGAFHGRVVYGYATTLTAPGHAAIYTGAPPAESGVMFNNGWDRARNKVVGSVDDGVSALLGRPTAFASPRVLRVPTVADVLSDRVPQSKVVSLSIKDRSAILPGGKRPTLALWFDDKQQRFTTSTWYAQALPAWLDAWQKAHPAADRVTTWEPRDPAVLQRAGRDDAPGEGDLGGFGVTFPHDPRRTPNPAYAQALTPPLYELLLELAGECALRMDLGADEHPDLLAISISGTDYVGHTFGGESWEALDMLLRVDKALDALIEQLERKTSLALLVTADHGVAPLAESSRAAGREAHRYRASELVEIADQAIDRALEPGNWAVAFQQPFLFLADEARAPEVRDRAVAAALEALRRVPGVGRAWDVRAIPSLSASTDEIEKKVFASVAPDAAGDVFVVPAQWSYYDEEVPRGAGTTHGSPWAYDAEVPVIVAGPGVAHVQSDEPLDQRRVAATLAALLGVPPPPAAASVEPLPGVARR